MLVEQMVLNFVRTERISIFGIASPSGFDQAVPGTRPTDLMPACRSVIVFGRPFVEHPMRVDTRTHRADDSWWKANEVVDNQVHRWRASILDLLDLHGFAAANFGGYAPRLEPVLSYRLAQFRAGIGVFGRFGVCIHPEHGCYYRVGVLLTDAALTPSGVDTLADFSPCAGCSACADICPVRAIDTLAEPARGYDRERCVKFILRMKERHETEGKYCGRCFSVCPRGAGPFI